jgi:predicted secreted hydrolase
MKNELACVAAALLFVTQLSPTYRVARPGYGYEFPRDHFNHPDFQTEWWYYTGNVQSTEGHHFGFELTFFRQGIDRSPNTGSAWDLRDVYMAHLALSDLDGSRFYHAERTNRAGPGIAGISEANRRIWNGNWRIDWRGDDQQLQAIDERFCLNLSMRSAKPPVIHGENGVSQKAEGAARASHYISLTRLITAGRIELGATKFDVTGLAWMDHEFFTSQLSPDQVGWDWLSIQLDDNTELMLFHLRRKDGSVDPYSAGTFVDSNGGATHLRRDDFTLEPAGEMWTSPASGGVYPVRWKISVPALRVALEATTPLRSQELSGINKLIPTYWEGAIHFSGRKGETPIAGVGYLEMTGYAQPFTIER